MVIKTPKELLNLLPKRLRSQKGITSDHPLIHQILSQESIPPYSPTTKSFDRDFNKFDRDFNKFDRDFNKFDRENSNESDEVFSEPQHINTAGQVPSFVNKDLAEKIELANKNIMEQLENNKSSFFQANNQANKEVVNKSNEINTAPAANMRKK